MKEYPISNCEKNFVVQAIKDNHRLDGRKVDECRPIKINFGADNGSAFVSLGETKVLAQVSCELGVPKASRPTEGTMFINVELGPMAAPHFETGRNTDLVVQLNRTLERTFKESRCVDLESLCVQSEECVWVLRVDLNVVNHDGNLIDCCSIATLCALSHFKRPDVSVIEDEVHIHPASEKDPIPIVLHHYPVCVSYCVFDEGRVAVADPTYLEERAADAEMVFGLNSFQELCCLNLGGTTLTSAMMILQCATKAARRAKFTVNLVKQRIEEDNKPREPGENTGFTECLRLNQLTALTEDRLSVKLRHFKLEEPSSADDEKKDKVIKESSDEAEEGKTKVTSLGANAAMMSSNLSNLQWVPDDDSEEDGNLVNFNSDDNSSDGESGESYKRKAAMPDAEMEADQEIQPPVPVPGSDSEEEATAIL